jgi:hypothetical protein
VLSAKTNPVPVKPVTVPPTVKDPVVPPLPLLDVVFKPLQAVIRNAAPMSRANFDRLLGIMFILYSSARQGTAVLC